jgi:hypothetical protein
MRYTETGNNNISPSGGIDPTGGERADLDIRIGERTDLITRTHSDSNLISHPTFII